MIYCCACRVDVDARLATGAEIYPHRSDLHALPFWKCDACGNYVGCHHKTKDRTRPLGCIPTKRIKALRIRIHSVLDPIWISGKMRRSDVYAMVSDRIGKEYHTGEIRTEDEAQQIYDAALLIRHIVTGSRSPAPEVGA